jgi:hypothetical protein
MAPHLPSPSHRWARLIAGALALPLAGSLQPTQAATLLSFLSSPYSWVGRGETVSAGPDNGFDISVLGDQFTPITQITQITSTLNFNITEPWTLYGWRSWDLRLAAPEGASLAVGSYSNATRSSFKDATAPGLDFSGNHRGNNRLTGSFNILESNVADDGTFSFAVDFLQYDEESTNAWIKGAIRYNSEVPINLTPEPIVVDPPIDLGYNPDPDPYPYLPIIDPIIENPGIGEPWPDGSSIDQPISILPYPIYDQDLPVHWYCCSSTLTMVNPNLITFSGPSMSSDPVPTPGPLPIAGALAGWHSARRLRRRCRESSQSFAKPGLSLLLTTPSGVVNIPE